MTISPEALESWQGWVGRSETLVERLDADVLRRYAAALAEDLGVEDRLPSLAHWAFFLSVTPGDELGPDGHPRRGGFLPPISLPRRMFAGSDIVFVQPLILGESARRKSTVVSIEHKSGKSGDLVLVGVEHVVEQEGSKRIHERQTLVYRDQGASTPPVVPARGGADAEPTELIWEPSSVELFRYSAVTFNSHRIHYDSPYASGVEGYPGLVVHGPLTAAKLYRSASRERNPKRFSFRAMAPLFADQPVRIVRDSASGTIDAVRCDGATAMRATASY